MYSICKMQLYTRKRKNHIDYRGGRKMSRVGGEVGGAGEGRKGGEGVGGGEGLGVGGIG